MRYSVEYTTQAVNALKKLDKDTEKTDRAKVLFKLQSV